MDALFDEVEELRMQLFESEMRCAIIEAEVREEVMREMELRMASMEKMYARRLMHEVRGVLPQCSTKAERFLRCRRTR